MELGSGNPGDGVCQLGKSAISWVKGDGSCTDVCAEKEMACSEYALTTLAKRDPAAVAAKAAGITCSSWINRNYGMGFSQCKGKACCQGRCDGSCFLSQPQRCDVSGRQFGHQRICPCQDLGVTDGWLLVLSSDLGSGGGDFAKPGYGYPSANFKTHLTGQELHSAGFDMLQIVLLSNPRQLRIFPGRYDLRKLDNTCTECNCPGNHLGGGLYWHGGGGKCWKGAHFGLSTTTDVHAQCSGSNPSWWGHFHRVNVNTGVYLFGNKCVSETEWDQNFQLYVKKSSRCADMPGWEETSGNKWNCAQYAARGICSHGMPVGVDCSAIESCTPERPCLDLRGSRCAVLAGGQCPRATKKCTKFSSELLGLKPAPWAVGKLGLTAQQACCACGGGAVDACTLALDLETVSSPYITAIPESIRPRGLACGNGARVQVFKYKLKAGSTITIGPASRTKMAHALYMGGDCPGTKPLECSTTRAAPMTYYNDGDAAVTLYYHVIDQHAWIPQTIAIGWKVKAGVPMPICEKGLDLAKLRSPYQGDTSTYGVSDVHTLSCPGGGTGHEQLHYYSLRPNSWISINAVGGMFDFSHELRAGGACPGTKSIACSNRPSTKAVQYRNTGNRPVMVYYIVDSFSTTKGRYKIQWQVGDKEPPNVCSKAIDLTSRSSPYQGHIFGIPNYHLLSCGGGGAEQAFTYRLPPGHSLSIGQTSNNFDSVQELLVGRECGGRSSSIACVDEPDNSTFYYFNTARQTVTVTFIIDSFKSRNARGDYTIAWNVVDGDMVCATAVFLNDLRSPYQGTTAGKFNTHTPSCGGGGNNQVFRYSLPAGFYLGIGQTNPAFGGTAELAVGRGCPGSRPIRCEGGSDSSGRLMQYHNSGASTVDVYFLIDAGGPYDADFTVEWIASATPITNPASRTPITNPASRTPNTTPSKGSLNPCPKNPRLCLSFVNNAIPESTCLRVFYNRQKRKDILREARRKLRNAYGKIGRLEGKQINGAFMRCGSMWVDMPVPLEDQPVLRNYFRRQKLTLLVNKQRLVFRLTWNKRSSTTTIATTNTTTITTTTIATTTTVAKTVTTPTSSFATLTSNPFLPNVPLAAQFGVKGGQNDPESGGVSGAVIAILVLLVLLLGAIAVIGFLLLRKKRRTERNAANTNDGHVYTVEPHAVTVEPHAITMTPPVPMAQEFAVESDKHDMQHEGEFDKHDMQHEGEFDKHDMQHAMPPPISAQIVSYDAGNAESTVSTDEASASAVSTTMNPMHATEFDNHGMKHTTSAPRTDQIMSDDQTAQPDANETENTVSADEAYASAPSSPASPVDATHGNDDYYGPMTAEMDEDDDFIQTF